MRTFGRRDCIESQEEVKTTLKEEIAALETSIKDLQKAASEVIHQRNTEHKKILGAHGIKHCFKGTPQPFKEQAEQILQFWGV